MPALFLKMVITVPFASVEVPPMLVTEGLKPAAEGEVITGASVQTGPMPVPTVIKSFNVNIGCARIEASYWACGVLYLLSLP